MTLEQHAAWWLRYDRRCVVVLRERWPLHDMARPDVFGVTRGRKTIEVEIKRTMHDYRANAKKIIVANREHYIAMWPHWFYYLIPAHLKDPVLAELPPWAGLIVADDHRYTREVAKREVARRAPENTVAKKLSLKQLIRLGLLMGSQMCAGLSANLGHEEDWSI